MFYTYIYFLFFVFIAWKCWEVILTDLIKITLFTAGTHTLWKLDGNFCLLIKYFFCWSLTDDSELPKPVTRGIAPLKAKRKLFEAPKPHYYYHLEYKLFPTDTEPIKADVVTYGVAAKIYSHRFCNVAHSGILAGNRFIVRCHVTSKKPMRVCTVEEKFPARLRRSATRKLHVRQNTSQVK